jgi:hypothetical protein
VSLRKQVGLAQRCRIVQSPRLHLYLLIILCGCPSCLRTNTISGSSAR